MDDLPEDLFADPIRHALQTKHSQFALRAGNACRYPAEVAPFASAGASTAEGLKQLHSLLAPGESVWVVGDSYPESREMSLEGTLECLQMVLPTDIQPPEPIAEIVQLCESDAPEMVALTALTFPGYFRAKTCDMGTYYGVRWNGELIAMGGERLKLEQYFEISGVCTHPAHRGKGLAASIIWQLVRDHRRDGVVSWLHVGAANIRAVELYRKMGFKVVRSVMLNRFALSQ